MKRLIAIVLLAIASTAANASEYDICDMTESGFVNAVGNMAIGSTLTAYVSGEVVLFTLTNTGWVAAASIPAVPTIVAGTAIATATAYGALHGACAYTDVVAKTSEVFEDIPTLPGPREVLTDWFCQTRGDCPTYDPFN